MRQEQRETLQQLFIRVCRDSGFTLEATRAARLAAVAANTHPLAVWMAMPDLDTMDRIANGTHPAARKALSSGNDIQHASTQAFI